MNKILGIAATLVLVAGCGGGGGGNQTFSGPVQPPPVASVPQPGTGEEPPPVGSVPQPGTGEEPPPVGSVPQPGTGEPEEQVPAPAAAQSYGGGRVLSSEYNTKDDETYGEWMNSQFTNLTVSSLFGADYKGISGFEAVTASAPVAKNVDLSGARFNGRVAGHVARSRLINTPERYDIETDYELLSGTVSLTLGHAEVYKSTERYWGPFTSAGLTRWRWLERAGTEAWAAKWPLTVSFGGAVARYLGPAEGQVVMTRTRTGVNDPINVSAHSSRTGLSGSAYDDNGNIFLGGRVWSVATGDNPIFTGVWEAKR